MKKLLAANWKENPKTETHALKLFREIAAAPRTNTVEVLVCPPFIYLESIVAAYKAIRPHTGLLLGAQDAFWEEYGAFTSEIGPKMLRAIGATFVIVGHSERRMLMQESDTVVNKKMKRAVGDGMKAIMCVGEPMSVRTQGVAAAKKFIASQIKKGLKGVTGKRGDVFVAYEPIWAIGTGASDTPEDAREMAVFIKETAKAILGYAPKILYGGSVNKKNVVNYVQLKEVDGALVGGASLKAVEFRDMIQKVGTA